MNIHMGCAAGLGDGGLGFHFDFVRRAIGARYPNSILYSRHSDTRGNVIQIHNAPWNRWIPYSPLRWRPGRVVFLDSCQFDRTVARVLPNSPVVYHSFPGYAEESFRKVKTMGGTTVLEAATVHVKELQSAAAEEHQLLNMGGNPFSTAWTERVLREYELADYITVASNLQRESLTRNGVPAIKILFAPLGVDTSRFSPAERSERKAGDKFRIIQVGQVAPLKGFRYLLDALVKLDDSDIELTLFGGIGWRSIRSLIAAYERLGVNVRTACGDPVPALQNAHLCVHAALSDGFGIAPLEAMAMEVPTVVTTTTGMKDLITSGVNGIVVPPRNPEAIAQCISEMKSNELKRQSIAKAGRSTAVQSGFFKRVAEYAHVLTPIWNGSGQRGSDACKAVFSAGEFPHH